MELSQSQTAVVYHMTQNFGGRKIWRNSSHQKLANNILVNDQKIVKALKNVNNKHVSTSDWSVGIMECSRGVWFK